MRTRVYRLPPSEIAQLEQLIRRGKQVEVVQRATAIKMLHDGHPVQRVAATVLLSTTTVRYWFDRWLEHGVVGLDTRARSGRPRLLTPEYWAVIEQALNTDATTLGYSFTIWTLERLRDHAERVTGIRVNANYLSEQMKKQGYVYRRPRHDLRIHQDAVAHEAAQAHLDTLKKTLKQGSLHCSLWTKVP